MVRDETYRTGGECLNARASAPAPRRPGDSMHETSDLSKATLGKELEVRALLEEIRPAIQMDGGDVEFVSLDEEGRVMVRLLGSCVGCHMSQLTLKQGIENLLMSRIEGVTSVDAEGLS
jgi:Fe-S cluster biogenesis protein NfuA